VEGAVMHKTFISYHHENDQDLKDTLIKDFGDDDFIDKSVHDGDIDPNNSEETIMRTIREKFLADSTVTLVLIGRETAQRPFVNSEIQASLWGDKPNGLVAVVRDEIYDTMFTSAKYTYAGCNCGVSLRMVTDKYAIYLPDLVYKNRRYGGQEPHFKDSQVYCSLMKYSTFIKNPEEYINEAFNKRESGEFEVKKKLSPDTLKI
jgi:hypothetical protein